MITIANDKMMNELTKTILCPVLHVSQVAGRHIFSMLCSQVFDEVVKHLYENNI
jgi:hypothetical protein